MAKQTGKQAAETAEREQLPATESMRAPAGDRGDGARAGAKRADSVAVDLGADPLPGGPEWKSDNLDAPVLYLNRELTWLNFNRRVLYEAQDRRNPLLERIKFIAIASSNTDEFFMKRIGGLKQLVGAGVRDRSLDGRTPGEQIRWAYREIKRLEADKSQICENLTRLLRRRGVHLLEYDELSESEREHLRRRFIDSIFPLIIPQGVGPAHPFPFISNLSLNLLVTIQHRSHGEHSLARVKVPVGPDVPRFVRADEDHRYVRAEDIVADNLDLFFPGVRIVNVERFRITRNANTEKDEDQADDLLELIESEVRERRFAPIVRLQVEASMNPAHRELICSELDLDEEDVFEIDGMVGKSDLHELANLNLPDLKYSPHHPIEPPRLRNAGHMFHELRREGDILVVHPYESFTNSVERFLREASEEPKVRAIKMTLYRTSEDTKVIDYLRRAAHNGKQVAVVVELKARFDERANIAWANRLEEMGIHVTYGVVGFKTHAKLIQVVRKDYDGYRTYSHIGTGNYHAGTARQYVDYGLLTADRGIGRDVTEIFNFLTTGYSPTRKYQRILMAPSTMKTTLLRMIEREAKLHADEGGGLIRMKLNALEDRDIVRALYAASRAGVTIDLGVRDTCRLRPGVRGLSETIRVRSVIGRFLEHGRLFYFRNGGDAQVFIGSADAMRRNLEHRVEVITPVLDELLKKEVIALLSIYFNDRYLHWQMQPDGSYLRPLSHRGRAPASGQEFLLKIAERRRREGEKPKKIASKGRSRRETWSGHIR